MSPGTRPRPPGTLARPTPGSTRMTMAHPRKFRFGVQLHAAADGADLAAQARRAEELGYSSRVLPRPLRRPARPRARPDGRRRRHDRRCGSAPWCSTTTTSTRSSWPRSAPPSTSCPGGRLELGIGAGWLKSDYDQSGIPMDRPKVRVDRMEEAIAGAEERLRRGSAGLRGRALPDHRVRRVAEAGPEAPPAVPHRRREEAGAVDRGPGGRHRRASTRRSTAARSMPTRPAPGAPSGPTRRSPGSRPPPATATPTSRSTC